MSATERAEHPVDEESTAAAEPAPGGRRSDGTGDGMLDDAGTRDDSRPITAPTLPGQPPLKSRRRPLSTDDEPATVTNGEAARQPPRDGGVDGRSSAQTATEAPVLPAATATSGHVAIDPPTPAVAKPSMRRRFTDKITKHRRPSPSPVSPGPAVVAPEPDLFGGGHDPEISPPPPPVVRRTVVDAERHLIAPVTRPVGRRPRVRRVTRVLRHVDPWSVFKVAAVFSMVVYGVVLTAGVLLWNVAYSTGTIDNVEQFFESFGWSSFEFDGGEIYHNAWIGGLFVAVAMTGFAVLAATMFNLVTDLVGGVRMSVLEEEVVERTDSPMRRFTVRRTTPTLVEERSPEH